MTLREKNGMKRTPQAEAFRWLRERLGKLTQVELAERLGVGPGYVSNVEAGNRTFSPRKAREIADTLSSHPSEAREMLIRLQEALIEVSFPEAKAKLLYHHLTGSPEGSERRPWSPWIREICEELQRQGRQPEWIDRQLEEEEGYAEVLLSAVIQPPRHDVVKIARKLGTDPEQHLLLAGYLPDVALDLIQELQEILTVETAEDPRHRGLLSLIAKRLNGPPAGSEVGP